MERRKLIQCSKETKLGKSQASFPRNRLQFKASIAGLLRYLIRKELVSGHSVDRCDERYFLTNKVAVEGIRTDGFIQTRFM